MIDELFSLFRQGCQWGIFLGLLIWLAGYGIKNALNIFKNV